MIVDRKEFAAVDNLEIGPHPRDLQIDYTSPTFSIPQKVKFRYKLDGYDDDWHEAGPRRQAFYTDVPPGKYTFRVIASNSDGVWNERAATLTFSVAPAYYQTTWFRAVSAVSFVALLWAAHRYRIRRMQHAFALTLEARVGERTRIARELHDTLLQSFHGLLLRFQTVSYLLPDRPADAKEKLDTAIRAGGEGDHRRSRRGAGIAGVDVRTQRSGRGDQDPWRRARERRRAIKPSDLPSSTSRASRGSAPDRSRRDLQDCGGSPAEFIPARAGPARRGRDPLRQTTSSDCACATMAKASMLRCSQSQGARGTTDCAACRNVPP